jgi:hypothetical protein
VVAQHLVTNRARISGIPGVRDLDSESGRVGEVIGISHLTTYM